MFLELREQLAAKQFGVSVLGTRRYQFWVPVGIRWGITPYQGGKYDRSKQSYKKIW